MCRNCFCLCSVKLQPHMAVCSTPSTVTWRSNQSKPPVQLRQGRKFHFPEIAPRQFAFCGPAPENRGDKAVDPSAGSEKLRNRDRRKSERKNFLPSAGIEPGTSVGQDGRRRFYPPGYIAHPTSKEIKKILNILAQLRGGCSLVVQDFTGITSSPCFLF